MVRGKTRCAIFPTLQASGLVPAGLDTVGYPVPWVGIVMAPKPHLKACGIATNLSSFGLWIQRQAYRRLVKQSNCIRIGSFDPLFAQWINHPKIVYCPDPVNIVSTSKSNSLVSDTVKPVVLVAGSIDQRKKVCQLAEVLEQVSQSTPLHLVIAGKPCDSMESRLAGSSAIAALKQTNSVDLILRRLTDAEVDQLFQRADIIWSGNLRAHGSSGAVVRAGMHSKPVVTMQNSILGNWMESAGGGPVVDMNSASDLREIFGKLTGSLEFRQSLGHKNFQLFGQNTEEKYCDLLLSPVQRLNSVSSTP